MNGLYCKMLQKAQFKKTMIADKISKIFDFMNDYDITAGRSYQMKKYY